MRGGLARLRSLWRGVRRRDQVEEELAAEFRAHIEMRAEDLEGRGLTAAEAMRRARLEFGNEERYRAGSRASRGLLPFDRLRISLLDVKLRFRMLARYPGLTLVAGLAMAFGIWVGASGFEVIRQLLYPTLPFAGGDRIVAMQLQLVDPSRGGDDVQSLYDLEQWRGSLRSVELVGASRTIQRNLVAGDGQGEPRIVAEITASAFPLTGVRPLLGRGLIEGDEALDAPPVVVLGHDVWRGRFGGDPEVVGRTVTLGGNQVTIVGVMPDGFGFPVAHELWTPLRIGQAPAARLGNEVDVFARLARGYTMAQAEAAIAAAGVAVLADSAPDQPLRPIVLPFARATFGIPPEIFRMMSLAMLSSNLAPLALILLIGGNVALLLFARAAARETDLLVRTALGASRGRLVMQLFAEALVLAGIATLIGLTAAHFSIGWAFTMLEPVYGSDLPFWFRDSLSLTTVCYAVVLALAVATLAGALPALKLTRSFAGRMKQISAGGGGVRLGGVWSVVIVSQIVVMVLFPAIALMTRRDGREATQFDLPFRSEEFVAVRVEMDPPNAPPGVAAGDDAFDARYGERLAALEERLEGDPAVLGVTFTQRLPTVYHQWNQIEVAEGAVEPPDERGHRVARTSVSADYFADLGAEIAAGRGFHSGDLTAGARAVVVNQSFVERVLGGRNAIGDHVRFIDREGYDGPPEEEWHEIVGVTEDLGTRTGYGPAAVYHPSTAGGLAPSSPGGIVAGPPYDPSLASGLTPMHMLVHVRGPPESFGARIREAAATVDPSLRLHDVRPLNTAVGSEQEFYDFWVMVAVLVSALSVLLALAGIFSAMSFAVSRRTREIGVRMALGGRPMQVIGDILRRPLRQVAAGVTVGTTLVLALIVGPLLEQTERWRIFVILGYGTLMLGVCLLASIVPTRRALAVEPTEALRADA